MKIDDIISISDQLNPKLWYNNNLRREVEFKLLQIAKAFIEFIDLPKLKLVDVTISGSNASYNYVTGSDIDLHLIVDEKDQCYDALKQLFLAKKSLFNDQYDISIRGINVEVYVQEKSQPHISNGIYSVIKDRWLKIPNPITEKPDITNAKHKFDYLKFEILQAVKSDDHNEITKIKNKIRSMRQAGLAKTGEFGAENIAFKLLRSQGYLEQLSQNVQRAHDQRLSLK